VRSLSEHSVHYQGARVPNRMRPAPASTAPTDPPRRKTPLLLSARGSSPIRKHAALADLPVDEIIPVADAVVVRPDPAPASASHPNRPARQSKDAATTATKRTAACSM
jgi:hypothetical protein